MTPSEMKKRLEEREQVKNHQLEAMLLPAQERLKKYSIDEICSKAGVSFDEETQQLLVPSLGKLIHIHVPDFVVEEKLEMWHHLTILQYLDTADGTKLNDTWIGLQQMPGGMARGWGFDKDLKTMFERWFTGVSSETFLEACARAGGEIMEGKSDAAVRFLYAPMFPVIVNFWEGDEEFPASGKLLVNEMADHYLTVEAAGGACSAIIQEIRRMMNVKA